MYVRNATHPTTPVEKAYVPPSLKPTQASLPSALVIPFVEKVQGKGNRAEPIATSSSMASEAINAFGPDLLNQHAYTIAQTEPDDRLIEDYALDQTEDQQSSYPCIDHLKQLESCRPLYNTVTTIPPTALTIVTANTRADTNTLCSRPVTATKPELSQIIPVSNSPHAYITRLWRPSIQRT